MLMLTMQTALLFTHLSPTRTALIDCVPIHTVHLPVYCVVCCPEGENLCYCHIIGLSGSSMKCVETLLTYLKRLHAL